MDRSSDPYKDGASDVVDVEVACGADDGNSCGSKQNASRHHLAALAGRLKHERTSGTNAATAMESGSVGHAVRKARDNVDQPKFPPRIVVGRGTGGRVRIRSPGRSRGKDAVGDTTHTNEKDEDEKSIITGISRQLVQAVDKVRTL